MITEIKTETVPLTLEVAKHYNQMTSLNGDRDTDSPRVRQRVNWLRELNVAGHFYSPEWSVVQVGAENGKKYRVDGAHSTQMLVESNHDFPEGLMVTIRHFRVKDINEAIYLWEQFNPQISTRSTNDVVKNRAAYVKKLNNVKVTAITVAIRGIAKHFAFQNPKESSKDIMDYIAQYPDFIVDASEFIHLKMIRKTGVVAAMFATWGKDQEKSGLFWRRVRDGSASDPNCPTRKLNEYLKALVERSKVGGASDPVYTQYVKCHHAWNAWRNERTTNLKVVKGCPVPKAV